MLDSFTLELKIGTQLFVQPAYAVAFFLFAEIKRSESDNVFFKNSTLLY